MHNSIEQSARCVRHRYVEADGVRLFYREAGRAGLPVMLLLHGFPSSSHQYRHLLPLLADKFRVIAPDLPGFGFTNVPAERGYRYSFASLAETLAALIVALKLERYSLYLFDHGALVGMRLALLQPERVDGLISQNGNLYDEGFSEAWAPIKEYWGNPSTRNRQIVRDVLLSGEALRRHYLEGMQEPELVAPESMLLDSILLERLDNKDIQLDLIHDYFNNLELFPPFQAWLRQSRFPVLVVWGRNDPFFLPEGAEAFKRDVSHAVIELLETGRFALESHCQQIADLAISVIGMALCKLPHEVRGRDDDYSE